MAKWNLIIYAPAYNVERQISDLARRVGDVSSELRKSGITLHSLIIVDDGSTDGTKDALRALRPKYPFLSVVEKQKNEGPAQAILDGMEEAAKAIREGRLPPEKTLVVRMDSDLEHLPEDIPRLLAPIASGDCGASAGYTPFDRRTGMLHKLFNEKVGNAESRKFLGVEIPQFCPGFIAMRADIFIKLLPAIKEKAAEFRRIYGKDMLTLDFVLLFLAKRLGEKISPVQLSPIEDKWIKETPLSKLFFYFDYHKKTAEFLEK